ncbi:MAG: hypothetical protein ACE5H9_15090 [Anaerolineae bacterium]
MEDRSWIDQVVDRLAPIRGLPVLIGLLLVVISLVAQFSDSLAFLARGNWLLHVGVIVGLGGLLLGDLLGEW